MDQIQEMHAERIRRRVCKYLTARAAAKAKYEESDRHLKWILEHAQIGDEFETEAGDIVVIVDNFAGVNSYFHATRAVRYDIKPKKKQRL